MLESIAIAKGLFVIIKKQHEFQEFIKLDQEILEKKFRLSEYERDELEHLNAVLTHSSSVKNEMWVKFNAERQRLMQSNRITIAKNLGEPSSFEDLEVVNFVLRYVTITPDLRRDLPLPLAHPTRPESWEKWGKRTLRSWFWDRTTTAGQLLTGIADLLLAVLLAQLFSGVWRKSVDDTDRLQKSQTSDKFNNNKADSDKMDFDFVRHIAKGGLAQLAQESAHGGGRRSRI